MLKQREILAPIKEESSYQKMDDNGINNNNKMNNDSENNNREIFDSYKNNENSNNSVMNHPIVVKLIDIGVEPIYSRRIFQYYHPQNYGEALEYLIMHKGIVQHHFVQDRHDIYSSICYLCGENKKNHLGYNEFNSNNNKK